MPDLTLVRHGQAQSHAKDEASYDSLSDLGHQQARWLGEHLAATGEVFSRVYSGTLIRQKETAASMGYENVVQDARLNELEYFTLSRLMNEQHGLAYPTEREEYAEHMPTVFTNWRDGNIEDAPETFDQFQTRVEAVLGEIASGKGRALVVSSGGLIGRAVSQTLGCDVATMARLCLAIQNTSVHRWRVRGAERWLVQFNALPHLDPRERQYAQTHL